MSGFIGDLDVRVVNDDKAGLFKLLQPFGFQSDVAKTSIIAPAGFTTDFCSVPRVPIAYSLLGNRARKSGTIHDRLYVTHEVSREMADNVLHEMLLLDGISEAEALAFYIAVRQFGGTHW